jgi:hypothetical protein
MLARLALYTGWTKGPFPQLAETDDVLASIGAAAAEPILNAGCIADAVSAVNV